LRPLGPNGVRPVVGLKPKTSHSFGANGTATSAAASVPFGTVAGFGAFGANDPNAVRADNMVQYFLPANLGGVYGQISYAFDEQIANDRGQYYGGRIGFAQGPFN